MNESSVAVDLGPVRKEVTVAAPQEVAFRVFTTEIGSWWPIERFGMAQVYTVVCFPRWRTTARARLSSSSAWR